MNSRHRPLRAGSGGPSRPLLPFQGNSPSPLIAPPATTLVRILRLRIADHWSAQRRPTSLAHPVQIRTTLLPPPSGEVSSAVPREADDGRGSSLLAPARSAPSAGRPRTPSLRRNRGLLRRGDPRGRPAPGLIKSRRTTAAVRLSFSSYYHSSQQIILPHELDPLPADLQRASRVGLLA